jgi:hypothetical protein
VATIESRPALLKLWERWKELTPKQKDETINIMLLRIGDGLEPCDEYYFDDAVNDREFALLVFGDAMAEAGGKENELS